MSEQDRIDRADHAVEQLAIYSQQRDQRLYGANTDFDEDGKAHYTPWAEIDPIGQQQYLNDAKVAVSVLLALGWEPMPQDWEYGVKGLHPDPGRVNSEESARWTAQQFGQPYYRRRAASEWEPVPEQLCQDDTHHGYMRPNCPECAEGPTP